MSERHSLLAELTPTDQEAEWLQAYWPFWARPAQLPPPDPWIVWLQMAGRGFGKTRSGAEQVLEWKRQGARRIALIAKTPADARDVMIEGESGLLSIGHPSERPDYQPTKRRLHWKDGAIATVYSGADPDQLRGPQHEKAWADELPTWKYPRETWDNLMLGLRLGDNPQVVVTTTPRPISLLRELVARKDTVLTGGSTYENIANLAPAFVQTVIQKYEGTSLGEQELHARLLEEIPGALWKRKTLSDTRITLLDLPECEARVVAIDPATSTSEESNETGIVVCGRAKDHGYVIADLSGRLSPDEWARRAVGAYHEHQCDHVTIEVNQGGDMARHTIHTVDRHVPVRMVHASRGKHTRAEPVAAKYEQGKVHHVGMFADLEDQLCTWLPGEESPDRLDAMVWGMTDLLVGETVVEGEIGMITAPSYWRG